MPSAPPVDARLGHLAGDLARFRAFVAGRVRDPQQADEVVQDAFARAAAGIGRLRADDRLDAWFYRILRNRIADLGQQRAATGGCDPDLLPAPSIERSAACQCLGRLIDRLPAAQAEVLRRLDLAGEVPTAVAADLGITRNLLQVRHHRARAALRRLLLATCGACAAAACRDCTCAPTMPIGDSGTLVR